MSLAVRVIPCLDVDGGRVVKGVNFKELRDAGDPVELARLYDAEGADELLRKADVAMYRAKQKGRAQYAIFDTQMSAQALERLLTIAADVRRRGARLKEICPYEWVLPDDLGPITSVIRSGSRACCTASIRLVERCSTSV